MKVLRITGDGAKKLDSALKSLKGISAKVGWVAKKNYEDSQMTTAGAAVITEYGAPSKNIPPRPHGRLTIEKNENKWARIVENESKQVLSGKRSAQIAMERIGQVAADDWRNTITEIFDPPLSPKTIAARKRKYKDKKTEGLLNKPLVDTGIMLASLTHTVERE